MKKKEKMLFLPSLFLTAFIASASCMKLINFTDCYHGEVKAIDVIPCDTEPCMFKKNTTVTLKVSGTPSRDAESGQIKLFVDLNGVPVEFPGIEPDICKHVECPVKSGKSYTVPLILKIEDYFPAIMTKVTAKATGPGGKDDLILCASAPAGVTE